MNMMDFSVTESISKSDAAARQLDVAIKLWFNEEDPVAVHTLACAACQIVHDLCPKEELLYRSLNIKDEYRKKTIRWLKSPSNFFKHAEKDPNEVIEFKPAFNEVFIVFSSIGLELLGIKPSISRAAFMLYFMVTTDSSNLSSKGKTEVESIPVETIQDVVSKPKAQFFEQYTAHWESKGKPIPLSQPFGR